jgi:drug/metabolite transporter (DMT)-like permease
VSGIVLLVLIGLGAAWLWTRGRKRLSMPTNGRQWIGVVIIVVVVLALAYGATNTPHSTVP